MSNLLHQWWWKAITTLLLLYVIIAGFLSEVPALDILNESIRNLYFHVPMWFGMTLILLFSAICSVIYLANSKYLYDALAAASAITGMVYGVLGLLTGIIWSNYTWVPEGSGFQWWIQDPRTNGAAVALLIYLAYFVLRGSMDDEDRRGKVSAVYSIFAFVLFIVFIFVIPRMTDSLHPGSGGNPGFSSYDLDNRMRMIFYPAVLGWTGLGMWITSLLVRYNVLKYELELR